MIVRRVEEGRLDDCGWIACGRCWAELDGWVGDAMICAEFQHTIFGWKTRAETTPRNEVEPWAKLSAEKVGG
jgi:hypothetical protein